LNNDINTNSSVKTSQQNDIIMSHFRREYLYEKDNKFNIFIFIQVLFFSKMWHFAFCWDVLAEELVSISLFLSSMVLCGDDKKVTIYSAQIERLNNNSNLTKHCSSSSHHDTIVTWVDNDEEVIFVVSLEIKVSSNKGKPLRCCWTWWKYWY